MKAVIFCGGQGTRLREETEYRPKPMVEVGKRPVLWHIMKLYASYGIDEFVLCLGYKGEMIKEYFLNYEPLNNDFTVRLGARDEIQFHGKHEEAQWKVTLADTGQNAFTASRLMQVKQYLDSEPFCVTYGDGVANVDIAETLRFHQNHGKIATVTSVQIPSRFGVLDIDEQTGAVPRFVEKGSTDGWVNGGYFVFNNGIFDYLTDDVMLEQGPLENLAKDGQLMAYLHSGFWQSMDTFRESTMLNSMWDNNNAPWAVWDESKLGALG